MDKPSWHFRTGSGGKASQGVPAGISEPFSSLLFLWISKIKITRSSIAMPVIPMATAGINVRWYGWWFLLAARAVTCWEGALAKGGLGEATGVGGWRDGPEILTKP